MSEQTTTATGNSAVEEQRNNAAPQVETKQVQPEPVLDKVHLWIPGKDSSISNTASQLYTQELKHGEMYRYGGAVSIIDKTGHRPTILPLSSAAAQSRFEKYANFWVTTKNGNSPAILTDRLAGAILESEERQKLPALNTLVDWPFLVARDGQLVSLSPGYNPIEGIYVTSNQPVESMSLEEGVHLISAVLLGEFCFLRESDRSRAIAAVLSPAMAIGRLIKGFTAPTTFEASESQTGKGTLVGCIEGANGEEGSYISKRNGGVGSFDESIDGALISGRPILVIDNLRGSLDSEALESIITKARHKARTPYRSYVDVDTTRFCLFITSNGAEFSPDMANRMSVVRLRKRKAEFQFTRYPEGLISQHAAANTHRFLGAIHTVIRAWYEKGRPQTDEKRHSFLAWSQSMDWIVQNIFKSAPLMDDHSSIRDRLCRPGLGFVRLVSVAVEASGKLGEELRAQDIFNIAEERQVDIPGCGNRFYDDEGKGARQVGRVLARAFGDSDKIELEEYTVARQQMDATEVCHHSSKTYRITRIPEPVSLGQIEIIVEPATPSVSGLPPIPDSTPPLE